MARFGLGPNCDNIALMEARQKLKTLLDQLNTVIVGKPSADWREEAATFQRLAITHIVCRNSGGRISYGKVEAARRLGLPVVMIERAAGPPPPVVADIGAVMAWLGP